MTPPNESTADELQRWLLERDPRVAAATKGLVPHSASRPSEPYVALLRAIVGQQLSVKAAASIWARVHKHFDGQPSPERVLATEHDTLRGLGLSHRKAEYVGHVATYALTGGLERARLDALDDEAIIAQLTTVRGVGRWTVEMILMFVLHRPDVFPTGDLGVQGAVAHIYGLQGRGKPLERQMVPIAEAWRPRRTQVSRLLWAYRDERM